MGKRKKRRYTKYDITMAELIFCAILFTGVMAVLCVVVFAFVGAVAGKIG